MPNKPKLPPGFVVIYPEDAKPAGKDDKGFWGLLGGSKDKPLGGVEGQGGNLLAPVESVWDPQDSGAYPAEGYVIGNVWSSLEDPPSGIEEPGRGTLESQLPGQSRTTQQSSFWASIIGGGGDAAAKGAAKGAIGFDPSWVLLLLGLGVVLVLVRR